MRSDPSSVLAERRLAAFLWDRWSRAAARPLGRCMVRVPFPLFVESVNSEQWPMASRQSPPKTAFSAAETAFPAGLGVISVAVDKHAAFV